MQLCKRATYNSHISLVSWLHTSAASIHQHGLPTKTTQHLQELHMLYIALIVLRPMPKSHVNTTDILTREGGQFLHFCSSNREV